MGSQTWRHQCRGHPRDPQASVGVCGPDGERDVPPKPGVRRRAHSAKAPPHITTHGTVCRVAQLRRSDAAAPRTVRSVSTLQNGAYPPVH